MNKNLFLYSALALTASVFADGDATNSNAVLANNLIVADDCCKPKPPECKPKPPECKPKPKPCVPCVRKAMQPIVLTSSRPCNDIGFYFFVDALYWHANVGNSDWAYVDNNTGAAATSGPNKEVTFKWNGGFRIGLGLDLEHDQWDTNLYYTWFRNTSDGSSVNVSAPAVANSVSTNYNGTFTNGSANAKLNFNVLDWELGRWFYVSNSISVRPHAGLKAAWIHLHENESYTGGLSNTAGATSYSSSSKSNSWALGPSGGINTNWYFGCGNTMGDRGKVRSRPHFSIFGDFAGAMMFTHFHNTHSETGSGAAGTVSGFKPTSLNRNEAVPVLQSIMGLAYDTCFSCDKYHFGIRVGYEFQWWFGYNQRTYVDSTSSTSPKYIRSPDDLGLQGLTIDVRFDF
jgi:hypothetical protein